MLQLVRAALPFGDMWTPILDQMVVILGTLQTGTIERLSFYKSTTNFVNYLVDSGNYTSVVILGHSLGMLNQSIVVLLPLLTPRETILKHVLWVVDVVYNLGGGIAIITGAQAGVQGVAVSGPNAMISRHRFDVSAENLERYTFNFIPDRDLVAMIDDPTKNIQRIECRADHNELLACHSMERSLCEALYVCGSDGRPFVCECTTEFGFPPPSSLPNATRTFEEACAGTGDWPPLDETR